jgi:hypothetical protein
MVKDNLLVKYFNNFLDFGLFNSILFKGLAYGLVCLTIAHIAKLTKFSSRLDVIITLAVPGGPMLGLFLLGYLFPFANSTGAIFGTIVSFLFLLQLFIGNLLMKERLPSRTKPFANLYCNLTNNTDFISSANITKETARLAVTYIKE